jgi:DNA polymerase I-like protein with 3'-5' exonuclease and polymerase domains
VLAANYGMQADSLATKLQVSRGEAERLLEQHRALYPAFWHWSDMVRDLAFLRRRLETPLGWRLTIPPATLWPTSKRRGEWDEHQITDRSIRNWPIQSTGADMMRLALVRLIRAEITVCAVVHDAFLIEASEGGIGQAVATTEAIMAEASAAVLRGRLTLRADAAIIRPGERYQEPRGAAFWNRAMRLSGARTPWCPRWTLPGRTPW